MTPTADRLRTLPSDRLLAELSLWSADLGRLAEEIGRSEDQADIYHVDVADGHFSPALLFFPDLVATLRKLTRRPLHVHLMVDDSILLDQAAQFADAGADLISVHAENSNADQAISLIAARGVGAGLVLQLHTPVPAAEPYLSRLRMLTLLGTRIGIKGQGLDRTAEPRLREARKLIGRRDVLLAADGGIREQTVPGLRHAGADTIVMGSLAFDDPDLAGRIAWVRAQDG